MQGILRTEGNVLLKFNWYLSNTLIVKDDVHHLDLTYGITNVVLLSPVYIKLDRTSRFIYLFIFGGTCAAIWIF